MYGLLIFHILPASVYRTVMNALSVPKIKHPSVLRSNWNLNPSVIEYSITCEAAKD